MGYKPKLTLLFSIKEHGDDHTIFWKNCINKKNCVVFIRSNIKGKKCGGVRSLPFEKK